MKAVSAAAFMLPAFLVVIAPAASATCVCVGQKPTCDPQTLNGKQTPP